MDRQHILDEIKRTALANGGVPLGRVRFLKETGIKESDWLGKVWPRWSEAVSEAGFTAQPFQAKNDRDQTLAKVISFVRRIGRLPTVSEMRLEKRIDPDFPNDKSVHLKKPRAALLADLLNHCRAHNESSDVENILKLQSAELTCDEQPTNEGQSMQEGTVYLILAGKYYKIGITQSLYRRASQIANGNPNGAELIHSFQTDDPRGIELYWHTRFAEKRVKGTNIASGEWFALSKTDVAAFRKRKRFM